MQKERMFHYKCHRCVEVNLRDSKPEYYRDQTKIFNDAKTDFEYTNIFVNLFVTAAIHLSSETYFYIYYLSYTVLNVPRVTRTGVCKPFCV